MTRSSTTGRSPWAPPPDPRQPGSGSPRLSRQLVFAFAALQLVLGACVLAGPANTEGPLPDHPTPAATDPIAPLSVSPTPDELSPRATEPPETIPPDSLALATRLPTATALDMNPNSSPAPPPQPLVGVEIYSSDFTEALRLVQEAGSYWTKRNGLLWSVVESREGNYNWGAVATLEASLLEASARGLEMILVVRGTPAWAQEIPGYPCGPIRPEKLTTFGDFLHEAVGRYSAPPYNVRYWELWNEPDASWKRVPGDSPFGCWGNDGDPNYGGGAYGEMLKVVYPRMKAANPNVQVLVGGLLLDCDPLAPPEDPPGSGTIKDCTPSTFLEGILRAGAGDYFDGVSFHAYDLYYGSLGDYRNPNWHSSWDSTGPVLIAKNRFLRSLLAEYGYEDKYLLNTEVALLCGRNGREAICQREAFVKSKSYYLAQSYAAAHAEGLRANIWFSLLGWRGSQLVSKGSLLPDNAYLALSASASFLNGSAYLGEVSVHPGVRGYRFQQGESEVWIFWSRDGLPHFVNLPQPPAALYDVFGEPLEAEGRPMASEAPLWAVFPPSPPDS